jgi:hypothetical protein
MLAPNAHHLQPHKIMKRFDSLLDGIRYQPHCPICKSILEVNDFCLSPINNRLSFMVSSSDKQDILYINIETEKVERTTEKYSKKRELPAIGYYGFNVECSDCSQYCYTLQLRIDTKNLKLLDVFLNSEFICLEEKNKIGSIITHEIRNSYSFSTTTYVSTDDTIKTITLPLIPINLVDTSATISKIKTMILFS